ncbi:anti-sigma regulatory factor (Ser/Thr protein kinase) [Actinomadura luteofluorescens]|uniref:Anti-sigma regulatory factor (Ser/Thr protein kinase) n=1 Tax=Actinomadura luteofluorescens TaxID=46163 RepID=A0A7Y9EJV7_9ACTN|nr:ATP-binding protein [Actinomadura luteofluorescens]NYD48515.1 anti-sigma regulatory factor (Ser/Thr protein kinase) [Actinomadura luteofluorescens]
MSTVELSFSALPVHVRTARLIVTAVARRSGVAEPLLDEVRLAVAEACSRAVEAHRRHCPDEPVRLELRGEKGRFEVIVSDTVPGDLSPEGLPATAADDEDDEYGLGEGTAELGLAVIAGLADDVEIANTPKGVQIRMSWPAEAEASI